MISVMLAAASNGGDLTFPKLLTGVLTGVLVFVIGRCAYDWWSFRLRRKRLISALIVSAAETLEQLDQCCEAFARQLANPGMLDDEQKEIENLHSSFLLTAPLPAMTELLTMLPTGEIRRVSLFLTTWGHIVSLNQLYSSLYEKIVATLDGVTATITRDLLRRSLWTDIRDVLRLLDEASIELRGYSLKIFKFYVAPNDESVAEYSARRWKTLRALDAEVAEFKKAHDDAWAVV